jgi:hypothetical protein
MRPGNCGNLGNFGNVVSVSYRRHYPRDETNPPLSAYVCKPLILIVLSGWRIDSWTFCPTLKMESMGWTRRVVCHFAHVLAERFLVS